MKYRIVLLLIVLSFSSCSSSKGIIVKKSASNKVISRPLASIDHDEPATAIDLSSTSNETLDSKNEAFKALHIVDYAQQFNGVKYKFGGTTQAGIDCSGLVFESFRAFDIILPRSSRDMAKQGEKITLENAQVGDLLFFKTMNRRNDISHVGLLEAAENGDIKFIHSTTQAGVIVSNLSEKYWDNAFVEARRIL